MLGVFQEVLKGVTFVLAVPTEVIGLDPSRADRDVPIAGLRKRPRKPDPDCG